MSEIARLRQQIELESAAMKLALYGFATVGKHEFISRKYDAVGKWQEQLSALVGEEQASDITAETYNHVMERDEQNMLTVKSLLPPIPLHQLKTPPLTDEAKKTVKEHGCKIVEHADDCSVIFPANTMKAEIFPRLYNQRYQITLPDGFQLIGIYDRCREQSLLFFQHMPAP